MKELERPHLPHVPTLTEVIEVPAVKVKEGETEPSSLQMSKLQSAREAVTSPGLSGANLKAEWSPIKNLVVPTLTDVQVVSNVPANAPSVVPAPLDSTHERLDLELSKSLLDLPVLADVAEAEVDSLVDTMPSQDLAQVVAISPVVPDLMLPSEEQIAQRVMTDVQRRVDSMLEFRLKEALAPILAKHSEALIKEMREELSATMKDVVARSVAQEMAKLRQR